MEDCLFAEYGGMFCRYTRSGKLHLSAEVMSLYYEQDDVLGIPPCYTGSLIEYPMPTYVLAGAYPKRSTETYHDR